MENSALELEQYYKDPTIPDAKKQARLQDIRISEVTFLRFLRTTERSANFNTLKIIGKGAFGEVRLVTRKTDGKVYALKSLVKSEMVSSLKKTYNPMLTVHVVQERPACSCQI